MPTALPPIESVRDVPQQVLSMIRGDGLTYGDRLPSIRQLSNRLNVRPHLVRDALLQLQAMGLVTVRPRARAVVRTIPADSDDRQFLAAIDGSLHSGSSHLFHLLEARLTLESELIALAATRRRLEDLLPVREALDAMNAIFQPEQPARHLQHDVRFHLALAGLSDNPVLTSMLESLLAALRPFLLSKAVDESHATRTRQSHMEIYRAVVAGNPEQARDHMKQHLQIAYDRLLLDVQSVPGIGPG